MPDQAPTNPQNCQKPTTCQDLPAPPAPPGLPVRDPCPPLCDCPPKPPGSDPPTCLDELIQCQSVAVKKAERAKEFVDLLTEIQGKVTSALVDYTPARYEALKKKWGEQDKAIHELIRKLLCAVPCWECLLSCQLCNRLVEIRALEERLNGPGDLAAGMGLQTQAYSLYDLEHWHKRNVANLDARVKRVKAVLTAWEKPSDALGEALDKNQKLIDDTQKIIATDGPKAVFDIFMTLLPRHWAIRPRDATSVIPLDYFKFCECKQGCGKDGDANAKCKCDEGTPDDCCGPDVGILSVRQRLVGPLAYIVDPAAFPDIICCLVTERLRQASDLLATAQVELEAATAAIEQATKSLTDMASASALEALFLAGLPTPFDCAPYAKDKKPNDPQAQAR